MSTSCFTVCPSRHSPLAMHGAWRPSSRLPAACFAGAPADTLRLICSEGFDVREAKETGVLGPVRLLDNAW